MKIETTAAIAEIVSSIAIVGTLAYLAVQSHQTNNMLVGNSRQARNEALLIQFMRTREYEWFQYQIEFAAFVNAILERRSQ